MMTATGDCIESPRGRGASGGRVERVGRAVGRALPRPDEIALGFLGAALLFAPIHLAAVATAVPLPAAGYSLRLAHHLYDLLHLIGLGVLAGLVPAALLGATGARGRSALVGWLGFALACTGAMFALLDEHLAREAQVLWGGRAFALLYPLYIVLCGLAVPCALAVGTVVGRLRGWRLSPLVGGLSGAVAHHFILRDDYPAVHAAVEWTSLALVAGVVGPPIARRLALARRPARRAVAAVALGLCALGPWVAPPSNAVRLELFREPGAVGAFVLARLAWSSPPTGLPARAVAPAYVPAPAPPDPARLPPPGERRPVVVLLTVEALRADVLSSRSHDDLLPQLSRLRDEGAYFPQAIAAGSQTSVSLATLFSGRYFSQLTWMGYGVGAQRFLYPAADPIPRFPALLTEAGVRTESYLGLAFLAAEFGLARGFTVENRIVTDRRHAAIKEVLGPMLRSIGRAPSGGLFAYAHVTEPHEPYDRGRLRDGPVFDRYVSEVAVVDDWVGRLRAALETRAGSNGYLIVSGDHGEAFGEHGTYFHTKTLYDELVRVPLIIWGPQVVAQEQSTLAGLIDVGPTVLELYGLPTPPWHMGQSLWPLARGEPARLRRPLIAEGRLRRAYFADDGTKVIDDQFRKTVEAFDLRADPKELRNRWDAEPNRFAPSLAQLRSFFVRYERRMAGYRPPYKR